MVSFLEYVAEDMLHRFGTDMRRVTVVFPNKRAGLFLSEALANRGKTIWAPAFTTISELFGSMSRLTIDDSIGLVCKLYRVYTELTGSAETLDHFYNWGTLMIADFDDIDKNLAPADKVLANVRDLHEMDSLDYLTPEQAEAIRAFFHEFEGDQTSILRQRFIELWSKLHTIYTTFRERLKAEGLAYEGMLYRDVVEHWGVRNEELEIRNGSREENASVHSSLLTPHSSLSEACSTLVFVGFNMLQPVERRLLRALQAEGRATFYWDFDRSYMDSEAGKYISRNLADFPSALDIDQGDIFANYARQKHITFASAATEDLQARYVRQWLREKGRIEAGSRTVVVLADEHLLPSVLHNLPAETNAVNITTGYPLATTAASTLVRTILELHVNGYDKERRAFTLRYVNQLLAHPYAKYISPLATELYGRLNGTYRVFHPQAADLALDDDLKAVFRDTDSETDDSRPFIAKLTDIVIEAITTVARRARNEIRNEELGIRNGSREESASAHSSLLTPHSSLSEAAALTSESLFRAYNIAVRLRTLIDTGGLNIDPQTLIRLFHSVMTTATIPFHGEPIEGIQVMGMLETRGLDFDHLLILSASEGNLPKTGGDTSFIPYSIRKAHDLTTIDRHVEIYAYYFFRLLARAEDITIVYSDSDTGIGGSEMSRFMRQMMVEGPHKIEHKTLQAESASLWPRPEAIEKTDAVMDALLQRFRQKPTDDPACPLLTPSAVNRYMRCQKQFYYYYVLQLCEPDNNDKDEIDNRVFGLIVHAAVQTIYTDLASGGPLSKDTLLQASKDHKRLAMAVDRAMTTELFQLPPDRPLPHLDGMQELTRDTAIDYLTMILRYDSLKAPITITGLEVDIVEPYTVKSPTHTFPTLIGGRIDRLDITGGHLRVIDYKTGGAEKIDTEAKSIEHIFDKHQTEEGKKTTKRPEHARYFLQALLYARAVARSKKYNPDGLPVSPALLFIGNLIEKDYDPVIKIGEKIYDVAQLDDTFEKLLDEQITDIFDQNKKFQTATDDNTCDKCPYAQICMA